MLLPTYNNLLTNERVTPVFHGRPGFFCIQYIRVFNFRNTLFLCLKLGIKYSLTTNLGYKLYRVYIGTFISGILVFHYPLADPGLSRQDVASACHGQQTGMGQTYKISAGPPEIDR